MNISLEKAVLLAGCSVTLIACVAEPGAAPAAEVVQSELRQEPCAGAVFTMNNRPDGNSVVSFKRLDDGSLEFDAEYPTGGLGSGSSLGSQGSVSLTTDGRYLLVVNAGSNEISSFAVHGSHIALRSRVPSFGMKPTSVAERHGLVYVLNAGDASNITGFWLDGHGVLSPIANSTRALSTAMPSAAQVAIAPRNLGVVVTEKGTNLIDTFPLMVDGQTDGPQFHASAGTTPYGFDITQKGLLVVSEAASKSASSYQLGRRGNFLTVSSAIPDNQVAPCWLVVTKDGRFAYTANAGSSSISGYSIGDNGAIELLDASGVTASTGPNGKPLDMAIDRSNHLYVVDAGNHAVDGFAIGKSGALTAVTSVGNMAESIVGVAAL